jgi:hypothetical protein
MKIKYIIASVALLPGLTGCLMESGPMGPPGAYPPGPGYGYYPPQQNYQVAGNGSTAQWIKAGYGHGMRDVSLNLPPNASRHFGSVPREFRNEFARSYNSGYEASVSQLRPTPYSQQPSSGGAQYPPYPSRGKKY